MVAWLSDGCSATFSVVMPKYLFVTSFCWSKTRSFFAPENTLLNVLQFAVIRNRVDNWSALRQIGPIAVDYRHYPLTVLVDEATAYKPVDQ